MPDNLTHRAKVFNSQMSELAPNASNEESFNMTHQAKVLFSQLESLAPDVSSVEPTNENLTEKAKLFNQFMDYFVNNPGPSPSPSDSSDVLVPPAYPTPDVIITIT